MLGAYDYYTAEFVLLFLFFMSIIFLKPYMEHRRKMRKFKIELLREKRLLIEAERDLKKSEISGGVNLAKPE